jgi:mono/diheme cytochrome c family protein
MKLSLVLSILVAAALLATPAFADEAAAKANYAKLCASCHGAAGAGDGAAAGAMKPKPTDFTSKEVMAAKKDDELTKVIAEGGAAVGKSALMPAYKSQLDAAAISDMVKYLRSMVK